MSDTDSVRQDFVELWGAMGPFWGVRRDGASMWLLRERDPATADAIVEGTGMSRGAVSMAVRELRDWRLVHLERAEGRASRSARDRSRARDPQHRQARKRREWTRSSITSAPGSRASRREVDRSGRLPQAPRGDRRARRDGRLDGQSALSSGLVNKLGLKFLVAAAGRKESSRRKR
jgi:DNA-binding transcriptional ArsR family regulator